MQCSTSVLTFSTTMNRLNRLKAIASNPRFLGSSIVFRVIATRSLQLTPNQVSHFCYYTPLPFLSRSHDLLLPNTHKKHYLSSKPNSIVELILTNDWSQGLTHELEKCCPSMTHETVVYILRQLNQNPVKASCFFHWVSDKGRFRPSSSVFNTIIGILANKETIRQFWMTLRLMKEKGFNLDEKMYKSILGRFRIANMYKDSADLKKVYNQMLQENGMQSVVRRVVGIILGSEWGDEVKNELEKLEIQLSDNFVVSVLKELQICPLKAYKFFRWVGKQSVYEHNTVTYNAIARVLARADSIEEFWSIIKEMKSVGRELDIDTYVEISRQLRKDKMMEDAVKLYELMMDGSYKPSLYDCSMLLDSISTKKPNLDLVSRVAKKYESTGHTLTKEIYDGIHRTLTSVGKFDEAQNIVETMRNAGYEPDNITYSQVVFGLCKMRRLEDACEVLEEMESRGCIPDSKTWSILIQGHCEANEVDKALLCFVKMIKKGCNADAAALGVLVDSYLSQEKIDDAYKLLVEMVRNFHASPWHVTYKKLIENLLGIGKFEEALELVCLMRKHKYTPLIKPVVQYVSKFGTVDDAAKFLKAWSKGSRLSHSAYLHVFESFIREGRISEAKDLLWKCPSRIRRRKQICELFAAAENHMGAT